MEILNPKRVSGLVAENSFLISVGRDIALTKLLDFSQTHGFCMVSIYVDPNKN